MLKNYVKTTLAVLKRSKFYTFISLFGICFTLIVIIFIASLLDQIFGARYPERNNDRTLYISSLGEQDTNNGTYSWLDGMSPQFAEKYVKTLSTPAHVGLISFEKTTDVFFNGNNLKLAYKYTDADFWKVTTFDFISGRPYNQQDISQNSRGIVISEKLSYTFFGKNSSAIGQQLTVDNENFQIIGVVRTVPKTRLITSADIYFPINLADVDLNSKTAKGNFSAILMASNKNELSTIKKEYASVLSKLKPDPVAPHKIYVSSADTTIEMFTRNLLRADYPKKQGTFWMVLFVFGLLFMLLPALNLISINISRMMERSAEIGIRKAFGASSKTLVYQFIIENILVTLLGGIIAIVIAWGLFGVLNQTVLFGTAHLAINWKVVLVTLFMGLIFSFMSGVYPAWRISKMGIAQALRSHGK